MQELITLFNRPHILLALLFGVFGALRSYLAARERGTVYIGLLNLLIGSGLAAWAADNFMAPDASPFMGIPMGISAGMAGGYLLDAADAAMPAIARDGLAIVRKGVINAFRRFFGLPEITQ